MRLTTRPLFDLRRLALTAALLGAGLAQGAGLAITSGSVAGQFSAQAGANGALKDSSAALDDLSGTDHLLGFAALEERTSLGGGPVTELGRLWTGSASFDASDAALGQFQISTSSVIDLAGTGGFDGGFDTSGLVLDAELRVVATAGETAGTPVRLVFSGSASSLFDSTGPTLDAVPSFDLVVRDADGSTLASWQGLDAGSEATFGFSLDSRVGDLLSFSLSHASTSLLGSTTSIAAAGDSLGATGLLSGTVQVTAVPEPESYALFIAGLAALGLLHKRQNHRQNPRHN